MTNDMDDPTKVFKTDLADYGPVAYDPVQVWRDLLAASDGAVWKWAARARDLQAQLAAADRADPAQDAAADRAAVDLAQTEGRLVAAAYHAFGLPPVDRQTGRGVTEAEAAGVLKAFLGYAEKKG
jgi:hypothetical protein